MKKRIIATLLVFMLSIGNSTLNVFAAEPSDEITQDTADPEPIHVEENEIVEVDSTDSKDDSAVITVEEGSEETPEIEKNLPVEGEDIEENVKEDETADITQEEPLLESIPDETDSVQGETAIDEENADLLAANNDTTWQYDYTYSLDMQTYKITLKSCKIDSGEVYVPANAIIDGQTYSTVLTGGVFAGKGDISKIEFENGVSLNGDMTRFLADCGSLQSIDLSTVDSTGVTSMNNMFHWCYSIKSINFGNNFSTSNVEDMRDIFSHCTDLAKIDLKMFDTGKVQFFDRAFSGCKSLTELDLRSFNTKNMLQADRMFEDCSKLKTIDISSFDTKKIMTFNGMFLGCKNLKVIDLSNFDLNREVGGLGYIGGEVFNSCEKLEEIHTPRLISPLNIWDLPRKFYTKDSNGNLTGNGYTDLAKAPAGSIIYSEPVKIDISNAELSLDKTEYNYTGKQIRPSVVVSREGDTLIEGEDYTVSYGENINAGTGVVRVKGINLYYGEAGTTFSIVQGSADGDNNDGNGGNDGSGNTDTGDNGGNSKDSGTNDGDTDDNSGSGSSGTTDPETEEPEVYDNTSPDKAREVAVNTIITEKEGTNVSGYTRWYRFSLTSQGYVSLYFKNLYAGNSTNSWYLYLYKLENLQDEILSGSHDGKTNSTTTTKIGLASGEYLIGVYGGQWGNIEEYQIKINYTQDPYCETEWNDKKEEANAITIDRIYSGNAYSLGRGVLPSNYCDRDYYKFSMESDKKIQLAFSCDYQRDGYWTARISRLYYPNNTEEVLSVYFNKKTLVKYIEDPIELSSGDYYLDIYPNDNCADNYTFSINTVKSNQPLSVSAPSSLILGKKSKVSVSGAIGDLSYKSSDSSIVAVSAAGNLEAKKVGKAKITVYASATDDYNAASKSVWVEVIQKKGQSLTLTIPKSLSVSQKGKIKTSGAKGKLSYKSSDASVVAVSSNGSLSGKKVGRAKITVSSAATDSFKESSKTVWINVVPKTTTLKSVKNNGKSKMTVTWAKNSTGGGYEIQYSTSNKFKKGNKTAIINKSSVKSKSINKLTKGRTYYVRIRAYKSVGGKKYYSDWSASKKVNIRK